MMIIAQPRPPKQTTLHLFLGRLFVLPFQTAIAGLAIYSGIISFLNFTVQAVAFQSTLPHAAVVAFNLLYVVAGVLMLTGLGWGYRNVETAGLILLTTSLMVRLSALGIGHGFTPETGSALVQSLFFGAAAMIRVRTLLRLNTLVVALDIPEYTPQAIQRAE